MVSLDTDKQQENVSPGEAQKKRTVLPAERIFNWKVYGVLNYGIQVTTSVIATEWIKHGGGKAYFRKAAEWTGKNIIPRVTNKQGLEAVKEANTYLVGTSLIMIGNLFLLPVKWFEKHKAHFVRKIDERLTENQERKGFILTAEEKEKHEAALADMEREQHPNWKTLLVARAGGLGSFYVTNWLIGEERNKWMQGKAADGLQSVLKNSGIDRLKKAGHSQRSRNFAEIAFVDFFYSIAVASSVFGITKSLTKKQHANAHPAPVQAPVIDAAPQAIPEDADTMPVITNAEKYRKKPVAVQAPHSQFTDYVQPSLPTAPQVSV